MKSSLFPTHSTSTFILMLLLATTVHASGNTKASNDDVALTERTRLIRSPKSRQQRNHEDVKECHSAYEERISNHCQYPGMAEPCYLEDATTSSVKERVATMSKQCCETGCPVQELETLCCRTPDCLKRCYGDKLSVGKPEPSTLYRYFDVLTQPHPLRRHKSSNKPAPS